MKILKKEKNGNNFELEVEIEFETFKKARNEVVEDLSKEIKIPGFRQGKAPKNLIEKNLNDSYVNDKATQHLLATLYPELIHEAKIDPVDYPKVEIKTFEEGKPLVFSFLVEVYPDVTLGKYKGLKITKKPVGVTEDEVVKVLSDLQTRFAKNIEIQDEPVALHDVLDLEVQAEAEGAQIKRWPRNLQHFPIGMGYISAEFDDNVMGLKVNEEKSFAIKFPKDASIAEISDKEVSFKVKVQKIYRKELLPIDDEFAKMISNFGTMSELKEEIKRNLEVEKKEESDGDVKNQLIELATKDTKFDIPQGLIDMETDMMIEELKNTLAQSNLTLDNYLKSLKKSDEDIRKDFTVPATARAKGKVVLKKIAEVEKLVVESHDLDTEIAMMSSTSGQSTDEYIKSLGDSGLAYVTQYLLRRKALDFLLSHAEIEEVK